MFTTLSWVDLSLVFGITLMSFAIVKVLGNSSVQTIEPSRQSFTRQFCFEFDHTGKLVCTNEHAREFISDLALSDPDWTTLRETLEHRFEGLPIYVSETEAPIRTSLQPRSAIDPMTVEIEEHVDGLSLILIERERSDTTDHVAMHNVLSTLPNIALVQAVSENAPFPVWQSDGTGQIGWSNAFYKALERRIDRKDAPLFELSITPDVEKHAQRISLKDPAHNRTHWFDVTRQPFEGGHLHFATDVHAVVNAETAQRNFVQTLAKTFAHLATGLAIFDRNRQLVLFNPSLFDLTELRPEFLTARPNLFSFFDQLRDNQIMPEPKNYANWRERIADVISAASDDNFSETWHLPNGLTYRVTGRPHPDGAIAFLFEDISAEISLTRRFRDGADVTRSALDALDHSIAIFNRAGYLQQHNSAMLEFLGQASDQNFINMSVKDVTRLCQKTCQPTPAWGEIRNFVSESVERESWSANLISKDGQAIELRVAPLASGASLVTLASNPPSVSIPRGQKLGQKQIAQRSSAVA